MFKKLEALSQEKPLNFDKSNHKTFIQKLFEILEVNISLTHTLKDTTLRVTTIQSS